MSHCRIIHADVLTGLAELADGSIHCAITSPPYFGLRDYGNDPVQWPAVSHAPMFGLDEIGTPRWKGHLGNEPSTHAFVAHLITVFDAVRRVLRDDGTLWVNLGDPYSSNSGGYQDKNSYINGKGTKAAARRRKNPMRSHGLPPKNLMGTPWMFALAMQARGWVLRQEIIWEKPNPMPESAPDRCTKAHEHIFLFVKKPTGYFWDAEAIAEPCSPGTHARLSQDVANQIGSARAHAHDGGKTNGNMKAVIKGSTKALAATPATKNNASFAAAVCLQPLTRNKRTVWTVPTHGFSGAHFATFPPDLIRPCVRAGTSAHGCCPACGAPWARETEKSDTPDLQHQRACGGDVNGEYHGTATKDFSGAKVQNASAVKARILAGMRPKVLLGWAPSCDCGQEAVIPCIVLDPFAGSGTTGQVALEEGRAAVLIEMQADYLPLIRERTSGITPAFL